MRTIICLFAVIVGCGGAGSDPTESVGGSGSFAGGSSGEAGSSGVGGFSGESQDSGTSDVAVEVGEDSGEDVAVEVSTEAAPEKICTPGQKLCNGKVSQECSAEGTSWTNTECPFTCTAGTCSGVCTPTEFQCSGTSLQSCSQAGEWVTAAECPFLCVNNACTGECIPGKKDCFGNTPRECNDAGVWVEGDDCDFVCEEGTCIGECIPNAGTCQGKTLLLCSEEGQWTQNQVCPNVCMYGACTGDCSPGTSRCNGNTIETCSNSGKWVTGSTCSTSCLSGACTTCIPGTKECVGTGWKQCTSSGVWSVVTACAGDVNANPVCSGAGVCSTMCKAGFADCTSAAGCESDLSSPATCGTCSNKCDSTNGTATCSAGSCGISCSAGWANCSTALGCETQLGTLANCTSCGDACVTVPNSVPACEATGCAFTCKATWGDCDGNAANGCEHDVWNDPNNCGACGHSCYGGTCSNGTCSFDVEKLADLGNTSTRLLVHNGYLYWTLDGTLLYKMPTSGGSIVEIAFPESPCYPAFAATDKVVLRCIAAKSVYLFDPNTNGISKLAVLEGTVTGADAEYLYGVYVMTTPVTTSGYRSSIFRVSRVTGTVQTMATFDYATSYLFVRSSELVVLSDGPRSSDNTTNLGGIYRLPKTTLGSVITTAPYRITTTCGTSSCTTSRVERAISNGDQIFMVFAMLTSDGYMTSRLLRLQDSGIIKIGESTSYWYLAANKSYLYASEVRMSVNGSVPELAFPAAVFSLALDEQYVYYIRWLSSSNSYGIYRLAI